MDIQTLFLALKTKYPQSGLSDNEIKGLATSLFATGLVTDENVTAIVDAQKDAMKDFQSLFDARFTSKRNDFLKTAETSFKEKYHINEEGKQVDGQQKPQDMNMEAVAKLLDERLKPLTDKIAAEESRRSQEQRTAQILEKAKAAGIKEELAAMLNVPSDVTDLDSFMKDKAQQLVNLGLQPSVPPSGGEDPKSDGKAFADIIRAGAPKKENEGTK